ncbi:hypothetical protein ACN38_g11787 [Penicillium nordicum]|uniref:Uncharacterized protein n=1 Tax=Penicillium nordicum TaxID=229535 RepID=A0A0M8NZM1_9EURO|nr:hypothetical protein ACN38_g11787 [Penicillium nordicum]
MESRKKAVSAADYSYEILKAPFALSQVYLSLPMIVDQTFHLPKPTKDLYQCIECHHRPPRIDPMIFSNRIRHTFRIWVRKRVITNPRIREILLNNLYPASTHICIALNHR